MVNSQPNLDGPPKAPVWRKNKAFVTRGYSDLAYLPKGRTDWDATLAAMSYSSRRMIHECGLVGTLDLNQWAAMHGAAPSARYAELGGDALVLWHGTSAARAVKIKRHGLVHKRGVWAATEPTIAHGFTRNRSQAFGAGSAMIVIVVSKDEWDADATAENAKIARFHKSVPPECIEYILWPDRIEFVGARKARSPKPWGIAHFKKRHGRWVPCSRPPVRYDEHDTYDSLEAWLDLSVRKVLATLGRASAIEVFSSLYATIDPWDALEHRQVLDAIEHLGKSAGKVRKGVATYSLDR